MNTNHNSFDFNKLVNTLTSVSIIAIIILAPIIFNKFNFSQPNLLPEMLVIILCPIMSLISMIINNNPLASCNDPKVIPLAIMFLIFPLIFIITELIEYMANRELNQKNHQNKESPDKSNDLYLKIMLHDFKNMLFTIYGYIDCGHITKAKQKIFEINDKFSKNGDKYSSDLDTIIEDLILNKRIIAQKSNINFNYILNIKHNLHIKDFDMCRVLGNVIDNSIEACKKIEQINQRFINIKITSSIDTLHISIENISPPNITLKTDKNNKELHGIGFESIDCILSKYGGQKHIELNNNVFSINITFPSLKEKLIYA